MHCGCSIEKFEFLNLFRNVLPQKSKVHVDASKKRNVPFVLIPDKTSFGVVFVVLEREVQVNLKCNNIYMLLRLNFAAFIL